MMYFIVYFLLHLSTFSNCGKSYKAVAKPFPPSPYVGNISFVEDATMFVFNDSIGTIARSDDNYFVLVSIKFLANKTYVAESIKTIVGFGNKTTEISSPCLSYSNGTYYLVYTENNYLLDSTQYAVARTETPFDADSWERIGNLGFPLADQYNNLETAAILWKTNKTNYNYMFYGSFNYNAPDDDNGDFPSDIKVIKGKDILIWENQSQTILTPRPNYFDDRGGMPGPSPLQLKSGDFLLLYNALGDYTGTMGFIILKESDPTSIIQRSDEALFPADVSDYYLGCQGLVKDPNSCPENASEEIGPEFADNLECFLGIFANQSTSTTSGNSSSDYLHFFNLYVSWIETEDPSTTTIEGTQPSSANTPAVTVPTSSTNDPQTSATLKSPTSNSHFGIIIGIVAAILAVIIVLGLVLFCYRKNLIRNELIQIFIKQQEISKKDAKALAQTVDQYKLDSKQILVDFLEKLGSGSTSVVYKGFLTGNSAISQIVETHKYSNCDIAIKIPKEINRSETEQIMRELQAMKRIGYNPHISVLLGWCFQNGLPSLVFELAQSDLFTYVYSFRSNSESPCIPLKELLSIAWQISVGMQHVASFKIIHRDLATRNILLYDGLHAKISDFGLCCFCDETFTYHASWEKKLPIRWLSIEALIDKRFSEKSDVWAFGVLLYEMCTNGAVPYSLMANNEIITFLQEGQRLEKPETMESETEEEIYKLMLECWKEDVDERLSFAEITAKLETYLEDETKRYGYLVVGGEEENGKA